MTVTDDAFDELLERVHDIDDHDGEEDGVVESERRQFVDAVDRAVKMVVTKKDGRAWYTHTLRRHRCRLHFVRSEDRIHLIACFTLDDEEKDYST